MEGTYHLRVITDGIPHWAKVSVTLTAAAQQRVTISDDAFRWRPYPTGPDVDAFRAEALRGVVDALPDRPAYQVVVTEIRDAPADTGPGDVRLAAARATCVALGLEPGTMG